jgi:hypothetical protein
VGGDPGATQAIKHKIAQETPCSFSRYTVEHRSNPFLNTWSDLAGSNNSGADLTFLLPFPQGVLQARKHRPARDFPQYTTSHWAWGPVLIPHAESLD